MISLISLTFFLALGATASSYGPGNSPIRINFESQTLSSPTSYTRTSYSTPAVYNHYTTPSYYSQPSSFSSYPPSSYRYSSPASSSPSSYSSPVSSSPSSYSSPVSSSPSSYSSPVSSSPSSYSSSHYGSGGDQNAAITSFTRNIQPSNSDTTSFTTSNGISSSHNVQVIRGRPSFYQGEYGQTVPSDTTIAMNGHSSHQSPEGMHVSLTWNADENGFSAQGDHLPKPVQLPESHAEAHRLAAAQSSPAGYGSGFSSSSSSYKSHSLTPPISYPSYSAPPQLSAYRPVTPQQVNQAYY